MDQAVAANSGFFYETIENAFKNQIRTAVAVSLLEASFKKYLKVDLSLATTLQTFRVTLLKETSTLQVVSPTEYEGDALCDHNNLNLLQ